MTFGNLLRERRTAKGLKQSAVGASAGLDQSRVARIESGAADPRLSEVVALCAVMEIPFADLAPIMGASHAA